MQYRNGNSCMGYSGKADGTDFICVVIDNATKEVLFI